MKLSSDFEEPVSRLGASDTGVSSVAFGFVSLGYAGHVVGTES